MSDEVTAIRSKVDLVDLIGAEISLKRTGKHWLGLCPFHEDHHPSFNVSSEMGRYRCWACGAKGDAFDWIMQTQNVDFVEALTQLAKRTGTPLKKTPKKDLGKRTSYQEIMEHAFNFFQDELKKSGPWRDYCIKRGFSEADLTEWGIGCSPEVEEALAHQLKKSGVSLWDAKELFLVEKDARGGFYDRFRGRLIFPIYDERGQCVAFGGRALGDRHPKYINSSDTPLFSKRRTLYGFHKAKEFIAKTGRAVLVEGYFDVMACHLAGVKEAVASLGTAFSEDHARLLKRWCDHVHILYDSDVAGQRAAKKASEVLEAASLKVKISLLPPGQDPDRLFQESGREAVQKVVAHGLSPLDYAILQVKREHNPKEEIYWGKIMDLLAQAKDPLEYEKHLIELSGAYPNFRDPVAAQRALRKKIALVQRENQKKKALVKEKPLSAKASTSRNGQESVQRKKHKMVLDSSERAVFFALLSEDHLMKQLAWEFCFHSDFFVTEIGAKLAVCIAKSFSEAAPRGVPKAWLSQMVCLDSVEALTVLAFFENAYITEDILKDAMNRLKKRFEQRSLRALSQREHLDDEHLKELHARLSRLKADTP